MKRTVLKPVFTVVGISLILGISIANRAGATANRETSAPVQAPAPAASPVLPPPAVTYALPSVVPPRPSNATPVQSRAWFDYFSWQEFIALNWPAATGLGGQPLRGQPDTGKTLGSAGPRVWETYKADYELFQPSGAQPSPWGSYAMIDTPCGRSAMRLGKGVQPKLVPLVSKGGSALPGSVNQAMGGPLVDQNLNYVRYEIRVNQPMYTYISQQKLYRRSNLPNYPNPPVNLPMSTANTYGAMEIKAAWREMTPAEMSNPAITGRYYITQALLVEPGIKPVRCRQANLGLIGLHIAHKTTPFKGWVWSTFEQVDNVVVGPNAPAGMKPSLNNGTSTPPTTGGFYPADAAYTFDTTKPLPPKPQRTPVQVTRVNPIPPPPAAPPISPNPNPPPSTTDLNNMYQALPGIQGTVWQYYQLVATQWPSLPSAPLVINDPSTANDAYPVGAQTPFPSEGVANVAAETYFQVQSDTFPLFGSSCMHCHYQAAQTDFSWVLAEGAYPANPGAMTTNTTRGALRGTRSLGRGLPRAPRRTR